MKPWQQQSHWNPCRNEQGPGLRELHLYPNCKPTFGKMPHFLIKKFSSEVGALPHNWTQHGETRECALARGGGMHSSRQRQDQVHASLAVI